MVDGRLTRINRKSANPGVWPELWRSLSVKRRAELDSAFQLTGRGVCSGGRSQTAIPQSRF
eukprot:9172423-Prorocentrum_lima.AAC.1